jgi:hypothetical protein
MVMDIVIRSFCVIWDIIAQIPPIVYPAHHRKNRDSQCYRGFLGFQKIVFESLKEVKGTAKTSNANL